jgi:miniconductance mechanosensitive channel
MEWFTHIIDLYTSWLINIGFSPKNAIRLVETTMFVTSVVGFFIVDYLFTHYVRRYIKKLIGKSKTQIDDILFGNKVFAYFLHIVTTYAWYVLLDYVFVDFIVLENIVRLLLELGMDYLFVRGIVAILSSVNDLHDNSQKEHKHSIKSYIQVIQLIVIIFGVLVAISLVVSENVTVLLTGLGAFAAVLLLVFKDSILGFVGGIQINANDMLRPGDWVSVPTAGADGTVIDISLTTVKIQNWDNTISTVPTYSLVSGSFHNWRGMEESGGRRIKRSINIDIQSIRFCSPEKLEELKKMRLITAYIEDTEAKNKVYNAAIAGNGNARSARNQTNIGIFRAYVSEYLKSMDEISDDMTFLVRQLQPTEMGLPLEVYVFSKVKEWAKYEAIQSDIFDHLFAIIPEFDLKVFQNPSGSDFRAISRP